MQIIGDPISAVEVKVLTRQTHTYKIGRVRYVTKDFVRDEILGDKHWIFVNFSLQRLG